VIAQRIYGKQTAWLGALLLAIIPALSVSVLYWGKMTEPFYLGLIYTGLATPFIGLEDRVVGLSALAGILFGLAYLTRPEAVVYFVVFLVFLLVRLARCVDVRDSRSWLHAGCFAVSWG
jgi:asparagine N-glycosylation enzyme membrane subunit Stt3